MDVAHTSPTLLGALETHSDVSTRLTPCGMWMPSYSQTISRQPTVQTHPQPFLWYYCSKSLIHVTHIALSCTQNSNSSPGAKSGHTSFSCLGPGVVCAALPEALGAAATCKMCPCPAMLQWCCYLAGRATGGRTIWFDAMFCWGIDQPDNRDFLSLPQILAHWAARVMAKRGQTTHPIDQLSMTRNHNTETLLHNGANAE